MEWEGIGAIGEVVGALGIIITLAFLAVQIRASTSWQKRQGFRDAITNLRDSLSRIGPNASLYNTGCDNYASLNEDDRLFFHTLISGKYAAIELCHDLNKSGDIKHEAVEGVNRWVISDFARSGVRNWWEDIGRESFSRDFAVIVDDLVKAAESMPSEQRKRAGF